MATLESLEKLDDAVEDGFDGLDTAEDLFRLSEMPRESEEIDPTQPSDPFAFAEGGEQMFCRVLPEHWRSFRG
jgi:hypothetical protein